MGFPPQFFAVLFAIPRVTGYLSHWREQLTDKDVKIARPQQIYEVHFSCRLSNVFFLTLQTPSLLAPLLSVCLLPPQAELQRTLSTTLTIMANNYNLQGVWLRDYEGQGGRDQAGGSGVKDALGSVAPSNAYRRRVAGLHWA